MREDMAKVLVERPRFGRGLKYPRGAGREAMEDRARHEPIKSPHLRRRKELNENLAPLRRFLRGKIGQRWDDIYSEICQRINRDSAVQMHIWQHLMWEVQRDPVKIQEAIDRGRGGRFGWGWMYVDPASGRLRELPTLRKADYQKRQEKPRFLIERNGRYYKRVQGIWYEVELKTVAWPYLPGWDAILSRRHNPSRMIDLRELKEKYGPEAYAASKRQLNKKEIRRLVVTLDQ
jgi:hypothetical protein